MKKQPRQTGAGKIKLLMIIGLLVVVGLIAQSLFNSQGERSFSSGNQLTLLAGSELKDIKPLLPEIESCAGVRLNFDYIGTLNGAERLASGAEYDLAWFSHAKYMTLLPGTKDRIVTQEKIMLSPVVMGVKQSLARRWGWATAASNQPVTWRDIANKSANGDLTFAMTNPTASNSGFTALVGVSAALSGNTTEFDASTLDKTAMQGFFKGRTLTAGSSGWLAEAFEREQDRVDGIINYESVLLQLNRSGRLQEPLTLIYPQEGIITADYPLMLLNAEQRPRYEQLVACLKTAEMQTKLMQQTSRRPAIPQVKPDQQFEQKLLIELPFPRSIDAIDAVLFAYLDQQQKPSHTLFVLDTSGSMRGSRLAELKQALVNLTGSDTSLTGQFARFRLREKVTLLPFSSQPEPSTTYLITDTTATSRDMRNLRQQVQQLSAQGGTAIYSSLEQAYQLLSAAYAIDSDRYYSIVLLTDGQNTQGATAAAFQQNFAQLPENIQHVKVFPILFGNSDQQAMQQLADLTGGRVFDSSQSSLAAIFKTIRGYQ